MTTDLTLDPNCRHFQTMIGDELLAADHVR